LKAFAITFLSLLGFAVPAASQEALFHEGVEAFRASNFPKASEAFARAARIVPASGTLQNLGLSEWQRGHTGEAILAWEQALWLDPFNRAAQENLKYARRLAQLETPELTWYEAVSSGLPVNWWAWIAAGSFWVAIAAVLLPGIFRRPRNALYQALAALGLMLFLLTFLAHFGVQTRSNIGFVLQKDTLLRLTPTQESQLIARLQPGEPLRVKTSRGKYVLVHTNRATGWIEKEQLGSLSRI
jgi:tetratricopeptide (TPR) repeat protein